jgi:hypothetical protein
MQRFDFVFSYWVFAWYVVYMVGLVPFNPFPFLVVSGIVNLGQLVVGYVKNPRMFVVVNFFIKVLPIVSLLRVSVRPVDIQAGFVYLTAYLGWMLINGESLLKPRAPFTDFIKDKYPSVLNG